MAIGTTLGDVAVVETGASSRDNGSYVDWAAIIAGIVFATAISVVLISFGSAIGLNFVDFNSREGASAIFVAIAAASWMLWVQISSFMAGGYLAGRLRRRHFDATADESDLRDGAHGLLVWAGAAVLGTVIALGGIGAAATTASNTALTAAAISDDEDMGAQAYFVDNLFRGGRPVEAVVARDEAGRILTQAALNDGVVPAGDRDYLVALVSANTGVAPDAANAQVDAVLAQVEAARLEAVEAARIARNTTIIGAFLLAASLLVSAIGAYWSAQRGGNHRDENTVFADVFRRF